jgi:polar amino acid transport system permease protein
VQLIKGTSLAAIVGFTELTRSGSIVANQNFKPLLVYAVIGVLYFALCWPLSLWGLRIERRMTVSAR